MGLHRGLTKLKNAGASGKKLAQLPKPASSLKNVLQGVLFWISSECVAGLGEDLKKQDRNVKHGLIFLHGFANELSI